MSTTSADNYNSESTKDMELAALRKELKHFKGQNAGRTSSPGTANLGRSGASVGGAAPYSSPMTGRTRWTFCFNCQQWGIHYGRECLITAEAAKKMKPQDRNIAPQGPAYDRQFPN